MAYDASFKLIIVRYIEETNDCVRSRHPENMLFLGTVSGNGGKTENSYEVIRVYLTGIEFCLDR
jgi:hypothetical protein